MHEKMVGWIRWIIYPKQVEMYAKRRSVPRRDLRQFSILIAKETRTKCGNTKGVFTWGMVRADLEMIQPIVLKALPKMQAWRR